MSRAVTSTAYFPSVFGRLNVKLALVVPIVKSLASYFWVVTLVVSLVPSAFNAHAFTITGALIPSSSVTVILSVLFVVLLKRFFPTAISSALTSALAFVIATTGRSVLWSILIVFTEGSLLLPALSSAASVIMRFAPSLNSVVSIGSLLNWPAL